MIEEWFNDDLRESGHEPLKNFTGLPAHIDHAKVQENLRAKWEVVHTVVFEMPSVLEGHRVSTDMLRRIKDNDHYLSTWTSYQDGWNLVFSFRDADAAILFKLMLP